ncbi:hypothetical protein M0802_016643 [Mischocyttarus mexicanus]|nr:hypothetical protein M0802_016643 [Mischocyttarus mexicanus]
MERNKMEESGKRLAYKLSERGQPKGSHKMRMKGEEEMVLLWVGRKDEVKDEDGKKTRERETEKGKEKDPAPYNPG